jgi:hypothetical protein
VRETDTVKTHEIRDRTGLICTLLVHRSVLRGQAPEVMHLGAGVQ